MKSAFILLFAFVVAVSAKASNQLAITFVNRDILQNANVFSQANLNAVNKAFQNVQILVNVDELASTLEDMSAPLTVAQLVNIVGEAANQKINLTKIPQNVQSAEVFQTDVLGEQWISDAENSN